MPPTAMATNAHSATATAGSAQPRRKMLTMNRMAAATEMSSSSIRAGSWAWTSV
jgi:hypothetical protein